MKIPTLPRPFLAASGQVATKSILNPLLWLSLIAFPPGAGASLLTTGALSAAFAVVAIAPLVLAMFAYIWFMFTDPDRLQSEDFRVQQQRLAAMIGDNRNGEFIDLSSGIADTSSNTKLLTGAGE